MKRFIPAAILLILVVTAVSSQTTYIQYFDNEALLFTKTIDITLDDKTEPNAWQVGKPAKTRFADARTKPNAILTQLDRFYPANDTSSFIASMDMRDSWGSVFAFQWIQRIDFMDGDGGYVEYSLDKGMSWVNAFDNPYVYNFYGFDPDNVDTLSNGQLGFVSSDDDWRNIWLCFEYGWIFSVTDTLMFRFTMASGPGGKERDGWMIDNMQGSVTFTHTINELKPEEYFSVYPNPVSDRLFLEAVKLDQYHVIEHMLLYDANGKVVEQWSKIPTHFFIDVEKYPSGSYNLVVRTNIRTVTVPIVIQHP